MRLTVPPLMVKAPVTSVKVRSPDEVLSVIKEPEFERQRARW